jgi:predicted GNAT superfamily acetyltransferase
VAELRIRPLRSRDDLEGCVRIQRAVWGHADLDITPVHNFCISVETGAILLGAFAGREHVGYVYSFPGVVGGVRCQHSHHLAVLPAWRGRGLGLALKRAQRREALARGYRLVTWTYDPMLARNANLNLHALGAVGRRYLDDFYGPTPALVLDAGVPTDRLLVEWWIASKRVRDRMAGRRPAWDVDRLPKAVEAKPGGAYPVIVPARPALRRTERRLLVELPRAIRDLAIVPGLVGQWQAAVRTAFKSYFKAGFRLEDFISGERSYYILTKAPAGRGKAVT